MIKKTIQIFVLAFVVFGFATPALAHEAAPLISGTTLVPLFAGFVGAVALVSTTYFNNQGGHSLFEIGLLLAIYATAFIHLVAGSHEWDYLLILNGLGYIVLAAALLFPFNSANNPRHLLLIITGCYTLITILGYFLTHSHYDWLGMATKAVEIGLLICLAILFFQERQATPAGNLSP